VRLRLAAGAIATVLLGGCGGGGSNDTAARRQAVTLYVNRVNVIERQMRVPLLEMAKAFRGFSTRPAKLAQVRPRLVRGEQTLRTLDRRLSSLDTPPDAVVLQSLVLQLVGSEVDLAHEVNQLAVFLPRFTVALRPLGPASAKLSAALAAAHVTPPKLVKPTAKELKAARASYTRALARAAKQQAAALDAYARTASDVARSLRTLDPSPAMAPALGTEIATLARIRSSATALAAALGSGKQADVARLNRAFAEASRSGNSLSAQRAEIAAVKAYDARVRGVGRLALRVERERARLQQSLK
jgi:hypothetical protein